MAYESPMGPLTFQASTGLRQYQFVALSTGSLLTNPSTLGGAIGVLTSSGTTGSTNAATFQTVQVMGVAKVAAGTTGIAPGNFVKASTDGRASTGTSTSTLSGIALGSVTSTSTSAEVISVLLFPFSGTLA